MCYLHASGYKDYYPFDDLRKRYCILKCQLPTRNVTCSNERSLCITSSLGYKHKKRKETQTTGLQCCNFVFKTNLSIYTHLCCPAAFIVLGFKLLSYLIGHNNSINAFRHVATHPSSRLCFLRAYSSWSHQSMIGLSRFGSSNGYKVVLFADVHKFSYQIPVSPKDPPPYERHGRANAATGY